MKKYFLILGFLVTSAFAFSQEATSKGTAFSFGPSVGFGHSYMCPFISRGPNPVGNFGIMAIYAPTEHWGIGGDIRHSMEGSRTSTEQGPRETDLDYLRIPIKGFYFFGKVEDDFRPKITLGPSFGFLTRQTDTFGAKANSFDAGINTSIGFNSRLSTTGMWLNFDINFYQGLMDVMRDDGVTDLNANIGLNLGLAFGL